MELFSFLMINSKEVHSILERRILADGYDIVLGIDKSHGMWLYDSRHDKYFLDFFGFFASSALGMNHPGYMDSEFLKKLQYASLNKVVNSDIYTQEMAEFVMAMEKVAPEEMKYMFFVEGGALAVENALKAAFDWKIRKSIAKGKGELGTKVIHLKEAFHGRSGYTLSLTNTFDPNKTKYFPKFEWPRVTNPKITFPLNEENTRKVEELEKKSLEEINNAIAKYGDDIAAFIMEPIQGEGGDNHFRKEYFKEVRKITEKNDIMLIFDEVQSGMGITGKLWAYQHFDVKPDMFSFGKKSQVCGFMSSKRIDEVKDNVFHVPSRINSTWGGNFADMVRATKIIEIMIKDKLVENAEKVGSYMIKRLQELEQKYPSIISNARGKGLMDAFDLPNTQLRDEFNNKVYSKGLLCLKAGEKTIRFRPPLIATNDNVDLAIEIMESCITEIKKSHNL